MTQRVQSNNIPLNYTIITVRGIHIQNGLARDITQVPSVQQFKKRLKSTLLSLYLRTVNTIIKVPLLLPCIQSCNYSTTTMHFS